jgi:asparagine synthase (glutamine-hydrolysing)
MPGIAGILDLRATPSDVTAVLRKFASILDVRGVEYRECSWRDSRFGVVNLLGANSDSPDQPAFSSDANRVMFLDGEVCNLEELRHGLSNAEVGLASNSAIGLCMALFERHGDSFVESLNGEFNIVIYDRPAAAVKVFSDRWGGRRLHFMRRDGLFLFSLERKAILAASNAETRFDPLGILALFTFGHDLGRSTVFEGLEVMPAASVLSFDASGLSCWPYWRPRYAPRPHTNSLADSAQELGRRLCRATRMRAENKERPGIFLSGGLDSRAVAGALGTVRRDVTAFTFGTDESDEVRFARQMAKRLGFEHRQLRYGDVSWSGVLPRVVWRTECSLPFTETLSTEQHRYIHSEVQVVFNGHFGDVLSGGHIMPRQFMVRSPEKLTDHILAKRTRMQLPGLRRIFRKQFLEGAYPEMFASVRQTLEAFEEDRMPLLYNLWDMTVRQRGLSFASGAVDRYVFDQVTPFVDNEVVDWALGIPLRYLVGQRAYKRMIVHTFPSIADVPWTRTRRPVPTSFLCDVARQGSMFALRRLRRLTGRKRSAGKAHAPGRRRRYLHLERMITDRLADDRLPAEVFDLESVGLVLEEHFSGGGFTHEVACLLTLAEGSRLFIEQQLDSPPSEVEPLLTPTGA